MVDRNLLEFVAEELNVGASALQVLLGNNKGRFKLLWAGEIDLSASEATKLAWILILFARGMDFDGETQDRIEWSSLIPPRRKKKVLIKAKEEDPMMKAFGAMVNKQLGRG